SVACTLSYGNFVQHQQIITEPLSLHDPLRFVYGQWNSAGKAFAEIIDRREAGGRAGEDFEDCVAAMLSLCGFRTLSVDRLPGLNKLAPDIVAADTKGNLLIVECTVKLPKADDKLGNLFNRYKAIREGLDRAGLDHIQTLPVLAVALSRDDISSYLGAAKDAGILLWGREDLHKLKCSVESKSANEIFDAIKAEKFMQDLS
ncbi:MAG: hypothetical protein KJS68_02075, partial [Alphaproteobacteria bacterium]|nr:hypothetical protein [Alphaproteobacteria bacterium]